MQSLNPAGLPPDSRRISPMKRNHLHAGSKSRVAAGEMQSSPIGTPRIAAISSVTLAAGSTPPMAGLGALAELQFDHLDLVVGGDLRRIVRESKQPSGRAAAEIARADLPDQVAAVLAVIGADAALAGVMGEAALSRAAVERADRVGLSAPKLIAEMLNTEAE